MFCIRNTCNIYVINVEHCNMETMYRPDAPEGATHWISYYGDKLHIRSGFYSKQDGDSGLYDCVGEYDWVADSTDASVELEIFELSDALTLGEQCVWPWLDKGIEIFEVVDINHDRSQPYLIKGPNYGFREVQGTDLHRVPENLRAVKRMLLGHVPEANLKNLMHELMIGRELLNKFFKEVYNEEA